MLRCSACLNPAFCLQQLVDPVGMPMGSIYLESGGLIFGSLEVYSANTDAVSARARHQNTYSLRSSKWTIPIFAAVAQHPCHRQTEARLRSEGIGQIHRQQQHPGRDRQPARCLAPTDDKIAGLQPSAFANQHDVP